MRSCHFSICTLVVAMLRCHFLIFTLTVAMRRVPFWCNRAALSSTTLFWLISIITTFLTCN
ncbi:hypothetical protein V8E36_008020 [Tilletia maclaganii]